jgi:hypothetical protein
MGQGAGHVAHERAHDHRDVGIVDARAERVAGRVAATLQLGRRNER